MKIGVEGAIGLPSSVSPRTNAKTTSFAENFEQNVMTEGTHTERNGSGITVLERESASFDGQALKGPEDIAWKNTASRGGKGQPKTEPLIKVARQVPHAIQEPKGSVNGKKRISISAASGLLISEKNIDPKAMSPVADEIAIGKEKAGSTPDRAEEAQAQKRFADRPIASENIHDAQGIGAKKPDAKEPIQSIGANNIPKQEKNIASHCRKESATLAKSSENKKNSSTGLEIDLHPNAITAFISNPQATTDPGGRQGIAADPPALDKGANTTWKKDRGFSLPKITTRNQVQGNVQKIPIAENTGFLQGSKVNEDHGAASISPMPDKVSEVKSQEASFSSGQHGLENGGVAAHEGEKTQAGLAQIPQGIISPMHTQIHSTLATAKEKNLLPNMPIANMRDDSGSAGPHLYATVEQKNITVTPTALEVGVSGGSHGWLKVRAEMGGDGAVRASVSSSNAAGTEMLQRELPSLTSYLHQEQVGIASIAVHAPSNTMKFSDTSGGTGQRHDSGQSATDSPGGGSQEDSSSWNRNGERSHGGVLEEDDGMGWSAVEYAGAVGWFSVRA